MVMTFGLVNIFRQRIFAGCSLHKENGDIISPESSLTPGTNTICFYYLLITPPSHCIGVYIQEASYFACG